MLGARGPRGRFLPVVATEGLARRHLLGSVSRRRRHETPGVAGSAGRWYRRYGHRGPQPPRHGPPLGAAADAAGATQERPAGEDPEPGVRGEPGSTGGWGERRVPGTVIAVSVTRSL